VLDLGVQPLANNLLNEENLSEAEPHFPLELLVCRDCWLMQIAATVPPVDLFSEYPYFSSCSDTMLDHAKEAAEKYIDWFELGEDSLVVEVGSNDGYMLKNFHSKGIPCLGVEPAANIAKVTRDMGINTLEDFFGLNTSKKISGKADLILGSNVFAHAPDINDFTAGLARSLRSDGRIVLEFPYAIDFIDNNQFDTIYHEHVFYFSLAALMPLFARHGLDIYHVDRIPIHGGSLRLFAAKGKSADDSVQALLDLEKEKGIDTEDYYQGFAKEAKRVKLKLVNHLNDLKMHGKSIAAYGACAKGSTLLNYCGVKPGVIDFIADRTIHKQGKFTPGLHIPIRSPEYFRKKQPDYALILTWNFYQEVMDREEEYTSKGGEFLLP
jgi:SAM-dependent methyltransferase